MGLVVGDAGFRGWIRCDGLVGDVGGGCGGSGETAWTSGSLH